MTNSLHATPPEPPATGGTEGLPAGDRDVAGSAALHPLLLAQLREVKLRTGSGTPDAAALLRLISSHYTAVDAERRGVVRTMQLMADEARALALEAKRHSSDHL